MAAGMRWPRRSAHLIMDSLNVQEKLGRLEVCSSSSITAARRSRSEFGRVRELLQGAAYKAIQVAEVSARKLDDSVAKGALSAVAKAVSQTSRSSRNLRTPTGALTAQC